MSPQEKHPVKTRIVVLEEHPLLRHGIAHLLNSQEDMIVCGETDNIRDARHKIQESKPHLLLTALRLGTGDSLEFLKALKSERPALLILVYSAFEETIFAERAFRAGAEGYVMKKAPKEELLTAIREILSGNIYVSHDVAMRAFKKSLETRSEQQQRSARPTIGIEKLSDRETHIFFLLGSGLGNTQIAQFAQPECQNHREPSREHQTQARPELQPRSGGLRQEIRGSHFRAADEHHQPQQKESRPLPRRLDTGIMPVR